MISDASDFAVVRGILEGRVGRAAAITKAEITQRAGWRLPDGRPDRRRTELVLETRRADFPFMVVASGDGVYLAAGVEDLNNEYRRRRSYIRSIASGWRDVKRLAIARKFVWKGDHFEAPPPRRDTLFEMPEPKHPDARALGY
jgi:hypothetical protein